MQGYVTGDIAAYVGAAQPVSTTYVVDTSSSSLALNISAAFLGNAATTSQVSSNTAGPPAVLLSLKKLFAGSTIQTLEVILQSEVQQW